MNVKLTDNVFHDSTIAALLVNDDTKQTGNFCQIIRAWINILNFQTPHKGIQKRDPNSMPFRNADDNRLAHLEKFLSWLTLWHNIPNTNGALTNDTHNAIYN